MKTEQKNYGSQYWLQQAVNHARRVIDRELAQSVGIADEQIDWVSPLAPDYREYQDQDFISRLGVDLKTVPLADFWPKGGPVWDGLARTMIRTPTESTDKVFLIEAKAHIPEVNSPESGASSQSLRRIAARLNETRAFLNANPIVDWTRTFFQYTNRIAHLYLLRELNGINAYLVNVYFLNETRMKGPTRAEEWKGALTLLKTHLGVTRTKLSPYMKDLFIDVEEIKNASNKAVLPIAASAAQADR